MARKVKYKLTMCYVAVIVTLIFIFQMHHYFVRYQ